MDFSKVQNIYFLGIGGIGMSALARYFGWMGKKVSGYDRTPTELTQKLESEGMPVNYTDSVAAIPKNIDLVIYTPAIPKDSHQFIHLQNSGLPILKRAQVLGIISSTHRTIAVAGTHGKTSVTTMMAHIFKQSSKGFMAFLGGISTDYDTNFLVQGEPEWCIVEADEYDRSFLNLSPEIAVITSMDADHLDIYGSAENLEESFRLFAARLTGQGKLITHQSVAKLKGLHASQYYYSLNDGISYSALNQRVDGGKYKCDFLLGEKKVPVNFGWAGKHNLENALAASAAAHLAGIDTETIAEAQASFGGVKRRFETIVRTSEVVYIDDYAHHPEELKTCILAVREMFPGKKITGIFQPHLYSRTRDFAAGFAGSLDLLDQAVIMDIYPARELPMPGVTSAIIFNQMKISDKHYLPDNEVLNFVKRGSFEVLLTLGAGNIDIMAQPIKSILLK